MSMIPIGMNFRTETNNFLDFHRNRAIIHVNRRFVSVWRAGFVMKVVVMLVQWHPLCMKQENFFERRVPA